MTVTSRVDDLRKRYHENPRRFFAPLANEYRKTGFIDRAILLCEKHLGEQPGNMNGLVVYGQCLFETGRLEEARGPFEAALAVDPENLIALRHLGDIARLGMDHATARSWYERVLELDRRNDEVIALLAEVGGGAEPPTAPSIAPNIVSVASSVRVASSIDSLGMIDLDDPTPPPSIAPRAPLSAVPAAPQKPAVDSSAKTVEVSAQQKPRQSRSLLDLNFDFGEGVAETPLPTPAQAVSPSGAAQYGFAASTHEPSAAVTREHAESPVESSTASIIDQREEGESLAVISPISGLQLAEFTTEVSPLAELESTEFLSGDAPALDGLESLEFMVPPPEVRASFGSIAMDHMSLDALKDTPTADLPMLSALGEPEPATSRASATEGIPLLPALEDAETIRIDAVELRRRFETPATFVTETMAALYLQQGLRDKAIDVYRQLIAQMPDDQGLRDRLRALERPPEPRTADVEEFPEFESAALETPEPPPGPAPAPRSTAPRVSLDFDTPVISDFAIEPPAPANAMLAEISFADVMLTTPIDPPPQSVPTPQVPAIAVQVPEPVPARVFVSARVAAGPSAREFFSAFARRALTPLSTAAVAAVPSAAGGPQSPLDELFGLMVNADDESSAHRLAAVGATSGPSGGSELDSVFGEGPSAPMPPELPSAAPRRGSVPRASTKLRFDQFFASSVSSATPSSAMPASEPETLPESGLSPESEPASDVAPESASRDQASDDPAPGDDDLDQFQGWLKRLTQ